jgi:hypothetical protein
MLSDARSSRLLAKNIVSEANSHRAMSNGVVEMGVQSG